MGAFNELMISTPSGEEAIQFKFGERWQYQYRLGDRIRPSDDLRSERGDFEIYGIGGSRETGWLNYAIRIVDGVLISFREISEAEGDRLHAVKVRPTSGEAGSRPSPE